METELVGELDCTVEDVEEARQKAMRKLDERLNAAISMQPDEFTVAQYGELVGVGRSAANRRLHKAMKRGLVTRRKSSTHGSLYIYRLTNEPEPNHD